MNEINDEKKSEWYCLVTNEKYGKKIFIDVIKEVLIKILGEKTEIFCIEENDNGSFDGYFFVKSENFLDNIYAIKNSNYFYTVLSSFDDIRQISEKEINDLKKSIEKKKEKHILYGDVVLVKKGIYSNLYGICLSVNDKKCDVGFKFCTGNFIINFDFDDLEITDNIFNYIRKPINVRK